MESNREAVHGRVEGSKIYTDDLTAMYILVEHSDSRQVGVTSAAGGKKCLASLSVIPSG